MTYLSHYQIGDLIEVGGYGSVYHCFDTRCGEHYAAKIIPTTRCLQDPFELDHFIHEIHIDSKIRCPNIVQLKDIIIDQQTLNIALIHEFCEGGTLRSYVESKGHLTEEEAAPLFADLMKAILYLHQNDIAHRDVKLENILLTSGFAKLADFGLSKQMPINGNLTTRCGSSQYVSPEVLLQPSYNGKKTDIWSAGISLYAMIFGQFPWRYDPAAGPQADDDILEQIKIGIVQYPDVEISPQLKELFECMFYPADYRFNAEDVLDHEWIRMFASDRPDPPSIQYNTQLESLANNIVFWLQKQHSQ